MSTRVGRCAGAAAAVLLLLGAAPASSVLPGIGPADRRVLVPVTEMPWHAVVRITTLAHTICTGVLVAPDRVVTAAHCLRSPITGVQVGPEDIHVLFGYARGTWQDDAAVAALFVDPAFSTARRLSTFGLDVAVLRLAAPRPAADVVAPGRATPGMVVTLVGFNADRAELLMADPACHVRALVRDAGGHPLLLHDCEGTKGASGGPLLARGVDGWHVVGSEVAVHPAVAGGVAVPFGMDGPLAAVLASNGMPGPR